MEHHFNVEVAKKYGVNVAIVLNHLVFWIAKNRANNKHFYEGRYWTYNSIEAFQELFPYWTYKQIRTVFDKLKKTGLVITGKFNSTPYDQTRWYALTDEGLSIFGIFPICPDGQIEKIKRANRNDSDGKPIPYNKPYNKPDAFRSTRSSNKIKAENKKKHKWFEKPKTLSARVENQTTSYDPSGSQRAKRGSPILEEFIQKRHRGVSF